MSRRRSDLEVRLQGYKERVSDVDADVIQKIRDRLAPAWPYFVERYAVGLVEIYVHLRIVAGHARANSSDFVAVFEASTPRRGLVGDLDVVNVDLDMSVLNDGMGCVQESVFVVVVDVGEDGERVPIGVIPSLVRLRAADDALSFRVQPADKPLAVDPEPSLFGVDRELDLLSFFRRGWSGVGFPERVRDVVERGAEVVRAVPNCETPLLERVSVDHHAHDDLALVLRTQLQISNRCVWASVPKTGELSVQGLKVSPCVRCACASFSATSSGISGIG